MKKIGLFCLFSLVLISSFAAFPVAESSTAESIVVEYNESRTPVRIESTLANWSLVLGLLWMPLMLAFVIFAWTGSFAIAIMMLIAGVASFIGAVVTGFMSLFKEDSGKWKAFVGLGLTLGIILLSIFSALLENGSSLY